MSFCDVAFFEFFYVYLDKLQEEYRSELFKLKHLHLNEGSAIKVWELSIRIKTAQDIYDKLKYQHGIYPKMDALISP